MIPTSNRSGVPFRIVTLENTDTWRIAAMKTRTADFAQSNSTSGPPAS